jgi:hypothetical protein
MLLTLQPLREAPAATATAAAVATGTAVARMPPHQQPAPAGPTLHHEWKQQLKLEKGLGRTAAVATAVAIVRQLVECQGLSP